MISSLGESVVSIAKSLPLIGGALVGLIAPAWGESEGPVSNLLKGNYQDSMNGLMQNYAFWDSHDGKFEMKQGRGAKGLAIGMIVHKVLAEVI